MKTRIYLRIGRGRRTKVSANIRPNRDSLYSGANNQTPIPTVMIALDLDIPDKEFDASRILLEAKIKGTTPCVEVKEVIE